MIDFFKKLFKTLIRQDKTHLEIDKVKDNVSQLPKPDASISDLDARVNVTTNKDNDLPEAIVAFDEDLLEKARTQWQFGDWETLSNLTREDIQYHPDRAKLALLVAAGHQQTGNMNLAKKFSQLAQTWGANRKLVSQVLIAGVLNSIARAKMISGNNEQARLRYEESVGTVFPGIDRRLYAESRAVRELARLGLLTQAAGLVTERIGQASNPHGIAQSQIKVLETEIQLLSHELALAQQRGQLNYLKRAAENKIDTEHVYETDETEGLKQRSVSQLGQDLWILERTNYKKGGFFVEFGATDGVLLSNTYLLEKEFGWKGICMEPNPKFYENLKKNRSCTVSDACISGETGKVINFILADAYGGDAAYAGDDSHKDKRAAYQEIGRTKKITTISLHDFLIKNSAPVDIDYISIDTEGSEYEILSAFPFDQWNVRLITVEHNFTYRREEIQALLKKYGYRFTEMQWDDWYEKDL